jgi:hypothetical protein
MKKDKHSVVTRTDGIFIDILETLEEILEVLKPTEVVQEVKEEVKVTPKKKKK